MKEVLRQLLNDIGDLGVYIGIPFFLTIVLLLIWLIKKSLKKSPGQGENKQDDGLI